MTEPYAVDGPLSSYCSIQVTATPGGYHVRYRKSCLTGPQ
jgi:hypothetical protein